MAVFQPFPRLYDQSGQGTTTNYYGGLNRSPTLSSYAGNQNAGSLKMGTATSPSPNTSPTPTPARNPYGTIGMGTLYDDGNARPGDGSMGSYNLTPEQQARLNGRYLAGNAYENGLIIDPNQLEYDDELGWMTGKDNIREDNSGLFRYGRLGNLALGAGFVLGGAALHGALGSGAAASPSVAATDMAMPTLTGAAEGSLAAAPTLTGGGAAASAAGLSGASTAATTGGSMADYTFENAPNLAGGGSGISFRDGMTLGGGLYNAIMRGRATDAYGNAIANAADRAGPYDQYRERGATRLHELEQNPDSVTQTPQYAFLRDQGEQGIQRINAKTGYFRSPNMLFDLSKFNQGLASQEYGKEWERRAREAGIQFDPSTSAGILAGGAQRTAAMEQADRNAWMDFGVNFFDWLSGRMA